jgi:ABC-type uncharacterized transport system substrate-binding protein
MKRMVKLGVLVVMLLGLLANVGFAAEMKKVLFLETSMIESQASSILQGLEQAGFVDQKNMTFSRIPVSSTDDVTQLVAQVQAAAPDVIVIAVEFGNVLEALKGLSIPVITRMNVDQYVTAEGTPTANITGVYPAQPDMVYNSYKFLQQVAPLEAGQQVVFLDNPEFRPMLKEVVVDALRRLQIPLKAVVDATMYEDWQQAILQYNDDPEVGWILTTPPTRKRDGSKLNAVKDIFPWVREHLKKPEIAYVEFAVRFGALCGFSVDLNAVSVQCGQMAARVLQGEPVNTIDAEYPQKVSIALNRKTATKLGIVFSIDVLNLANVIYDDYEGKQVIRK